MNGNYGISHIKGVIPAMISTFDESENLDLSRAEIITEYLIQAGVNGLYITGSTGEGFLMTDDERMRFTETVIRKTAGRIPVIVHVGSIGTKKSCDLARHARQAGADAVSSVPPFYYPFGADDIYNYYSDISRAAELPMIVYNIALAGLMNTDLVRRLATIDGVSGLKFTGTQHYDMAELKQELGGGFMVYSGCDEMATQGLLAGADGIIGSFYNLMPDTFLEIYRLCCEKDYAAAFEIQKAATAFILKGVRHGAFGVIKQCLMDTGIDAGYMRKPFTNPGRDVMDGIWSFAKELQRNSGDIHMAFISRYIKE